MLFRKSKLFNQCQKGGNWIISSHEELEYGVIETVIERIKEYKEYTILLKVEPFILHVNIEINIGPM